MKQSIRTWVTCAASITAAYYVFATAQATANSDSYVDSRSLVSLQQAPEVLTIGESVLRLKAFIWRDFMPMGVPDDPNAARAVVADARGMRASIQLIDDKGTPIPSMLHADTVWIIQGDQIWTTKAIEERRDALNSSRCEFAIAKGPMWQPSSYVDVVIGLKDGKGATSLLAIRHQIIKASV